MVGDNPDRLKSALEIAAGRADAVITTGGLGPTVDDLTKETIAEYCGLKCVMDEESKERIINRFKKAIPICLKIISSRRRCLRDVLF